jgi:hypothetical protein
VVRRPGGAAWPQSAKELNAAGSFWRVERIDALDGVAALLERCDSREGDEVALHRAHEGAGARMEAMRRECRVVRITCIDYKTSNRV